MVSLRGHATNAGWPGLWVLPAASILFLLAKHTQSFKPHLPFVLKELSRKATTHLRSKFIRLTTRFALRLP